MMVPRFSSSNFYTPRVVVVIAIGVACTSLLLIGATNAEWRSGFPDHGTVHEQMGQKHWGHVDYTEFDEKPNYTDPKVYSSYGMKRVFNASHVVVEWILTHNPAIPEGYISVKGDDTLVLGHKVEFNDWHGLLTEYFVIFIWVCLLLLIIVLVPFLAVCYCCFCCCRRCNPGCPPCDYARDMQCMVILGLLLLLLILLMICGAIIVAVCNRLLDRGVQEAADTVRRGNEDVCIFLKNTNEHIHHVFSNNYEELYNHLHQIMMDGEHHLTMDVVDISGADALEELARILDNMPEALEVMREVNFLEKQMRFLGDQLRDGLRGIKRELNDAYSTIGQPYDMYKFLQNSLIEFIDSSKCLHFDEMPDTKRYVQGIDEIIQGKYVEIPKEGISRFKTITDAVKKNIEKIGPMIMIDMGHGRDKLLQYSLRIQNIIDAIISDMHLNALRTAKSFEDVYSKYGTHRSIVNSIAWVLVVLIALTLLLGLIFGCCINRKNGATCLLLGIILIFLFISFVTLVSLFYFIIGLISYHGGCAPYKDKSNEIYRQMDSIVDVNRYMLKAETSPPQPPLRVSNAIAACEAHQTIFQVMLENSLFDIEELINLNILKTKTFDPVEDDSDFSESILLTVEEITKLHELTKGNLSTYTSNHYLLSVCKDFTPIQLDGTDDSETYLSTRIRDLAQLLYWIEYLPNREPVRMTMFSHARALKKYQSLFLKPLEDAYNNLKVKLAKVDKLISVRGITFGSSISSMVNDVIRSQLFIQQRGKAYIHSILQNLTDNAGLEVSEYIDRVISHCNTKIGLCEPLAYIYHRSVTDICNRLVDPINGIWLGLLPCILAMIPALFLAHHLMCLFKKHGLGARAGHFAEMGRSCPVCTGMAMVSPIIGAPSHAPPPGRVQRENAGEELQLESRVEPTETAKEEDPELLLSKRKQD